MKFYPQPDYMDCGPACVAMIASYFGKNINFNYIREESNITREGVSLLGISLALEAIGIESKSYKVNPSLLQDELIYPIIMHWHQGHFVVLERIFKPIRITFLGRTFSLVKQKYKIADPGHGIVYLNQKQLESSWLSGHSKGLILIPIPTEKFYQSNFPKSNKKTIKYFFPYLKLYRKEIFYIFIFLSIGTCINFTLPFITQYLIDSGIDQKNISIINYILFAQLSLATGSIIIQLFRDWFVLYTGTRLGISIISDFIKKMLRQPIKFFDTKMIGDLSQRIQDNNRITEFITTESATTFFSLISFSIFFLVLLFYDLVILIVYLSLTLLAVGWSIFFLRKRGMLNYYRFQEQGQNQNSVYEIISGVTELKLNQFELYKTKKWEEIQEKLFTINIRILRVNQLQYSGFELINQLKNILITYLSALYVVNGSMTLGELLSVSYIIGQMNSPVNQIVSFLRSLQDAKLSITRLNEIQGQPDEEQDEHIRLKEINNYSGIEFQNVSFQYSGPKSPLALDDVSFLIPKGQVTAIVGESGSGKTTIMKMILRFYDPTKGKILFNGINITDISPKSIRELCGVVMQDGFIFADTIERNIATGDEQICYDRLNKAINLTNLNNYINKLPLKHKTKLGIVGEGISGGQKQRILIARAIYKNADYLLLDEATSALDSENEKAIHENLHKFFKNKTVLIIAHRLSTVKNADNILVLRNGKIVEEGNHEVLVEKKGEYFNLIKNQLELAK